jgi:hypothetical protein
MSDQSDDEDGEIIVTPPQPIHDTTRTEITWREAYRHLSEFGGWKSVNNKRHPLYDFPLQKSTRVAKRNAQKRPDGRVNYRFYSFDAISYNNQTFNFPDIALIGFGDSVLIGNSEASRIDASFALLLYAATNNLQIPELTSALGLLHSVADAGYKLVPIFNPRFGNWGTLPTPVFRFLFG